MYTKSSEQCDALSLSKHLAHAQTEKTREQVHGLADHDLRPSTVLEKMKRKSETHAARQRKWLKGLLKSHTIDHTQINSNHPKNLETWLLGSVVDARRVRVRDLKKRNHDL